MMPNQITAANAGIALSFHVEHAWPGVAEFSSFGKMSTPHQRIEFLNSHAVYKERTHLHNRTYICLKCGALRRGRAHYVPCGPPAPQHCGSTMICLSHEQTVAATHLTAGRRVDWMCSGGQVREVGGKRKWRACYETT